MALHTTSVVPIKHEQVMQAVDQLDTDNEEVMKGFKEAGYDGKTGYAATCSCGWAANNPLATEAVATIDADAHERAVTGG